MRAFPFLTLSQALIVLRIAVAIFFMAHAAMRIYNGTIPRFGGFLETKGFPMGEVWVWAITATELIAGSMMIAGRHLRWSALGLMAIAFGGIVLIHFNKGWFVGEHGTGGMEYSLSLFVSLLVIAASDTNRRQVGLVNT